MWIIQHYPTHNSSCGDYLITSQPGHAPARCRLRPPGVLEPLREGVASTSLRMLSCGDPAGRVQPWGEPCQHSRGLVQQMVSHDEKWWLSHVWTIVMAKFMVKPWLVVHHGKLWWLLMYWELKWATIARLPNEWAACLHWRITGLSGYGALYAQLPMAVHLKNRSGFVDPWKFWEWAVPYSARIS